MYERFRRARYGLMSPVQQFFRTESASGVALMAATLLALIVANSPLREIYFHLLEVPLRIGAASFQLELTLLHFIDDGLMAVFFLLVGLEIKREIRFGQLSDVRSAAMPIVAAFGGAAVPALIYVSINRTGEALGGWAIPMATDIAFALGVLALLGPRIPSWLKIFLMTLAIVDDLIAIVVIAVFYTAELSTEALIWAGGLAALLIVMNAIGVYRLAPYMIVGAGLWYAVLQSGVHATIAGVVLGLTIPAVRSRDAEEEARIADETIALFRAGIAKARVAAEVEQYETALNQLDAMVVRTENPLHRLERKLHGPVAFGIMPLFALANAGVVLSADALAAGARSGVAPGIFLGLLFGKQIGIFLAAWLMMRLGFSSLVPSRDRLRPLYGAALLGGIGFTMSLFIAALAFSRGDLLEPAKMGILAASVASGIAGYLVLRGLPVREGVEEMED
jgi:NhaA family Na+:H+ antiporter